MHPSCPCFIDCSPSYWLDNLLIGWICRTDGTRPLQGRPSLQHHAGLAEAQAGESHQSRRVERTDGTQHYRSRGFLRRQHAQHHSHRHDQRGMLIINGNSATAVRTIHVVGESSEFALLEILRRSDSPSGTGRCVCVTDNRRGKISYILHTTGLYGWQQQVFSCSEKERERERALRITKMGERIMPERS